MKTILLALMLIAPVSAQAQTQTSMLANPAPSSAAQAHPQGQIESSVAVSDPMFHVSTKALGLDRGVEMLQWRKVESAAAPPHYEQAWTAERIDSSGFDAAHKNPNDLPFNGERWWSVDPKLDAHPVAADVLAALDSWSPLKPDLTQLPTNLAVSFQPDGDWLSTSQDPAHPQVGDVRVHWRVIAHAPAPAGAMLVAGRWEMRASPEAFVTLGANLPPPAATPASAASTSDMRGWLRRMLGDHLTWWIVGGLVLALLLLAWKRRR